MTRLARRDEPLDPARLRRAFGTTTRWHVLTGAACCGKTTLVDMLASRGFAVLQESARWHFDRALTAGTTLEELRADDHALQRAIAALQGLWEQDLDASTTTFLDRGLPDSLTFYRLVGLDPNEILPACFRHQYASVFILDRLPAHRDRMLGPEDEQSSAFLDEWLERDYRALGYSVVRVPQLPPAARMDFVLDRLPRVM
jgi:predicted ATPase